VPDQQFRDAATDVLKTVAPIVISAIAVTISLVTYWMSRRPANIEVSIGERIEIFHDKDQALNVHLPIIVENTGAQVGVIRSLGLILRDPQTKEAVFLKWMGLLRPTEETWTWESNATPLSIPAHSDATKMAHFYGAGSVAGWLPKPIDYELYLLAWTSDSQLPSKQCLVNWVFNEKDVSTMKLNLEMVRTGGAALSTWVIRPGYGPDSKRLSASEFDELVRK
jgi:hypothetical protein